jgi:DNA-binding NarL/FixJ family response regulator
MNLDDLPLTALEPQAEISMDGRHVWRLLIVDDQPICRQGLRSILDSVDDLRVCAEAENVAEALTAIEHVAPDLLIAEIDLLKGDGVQLIREVRHHHPKLRILILSTYDEDIYAQRMLSLGVRGYIMKQSDSAQLVAAIRRVLAGGIYVSKPLGNRITQRLLSGTASRSRHAIEKLSNRELQILRMIGKGLSTRETAECLHLSAKTIEAHRYRIRNKLNLKSGLQLIQYAVRWNPDFAQQ